jgi:hypothetical protein
MGFLWGLIPATIFIVVGYFILFSSIKAEGAIKRFGQILAIWVFIVALFSLICSSYMCQTWKCQTWQCPMHKMKMPAEK